MRSAKKKLGEILIESGVVTAEDIKVALAQQNSGEPSRLGDLLVSLGRVTPAQLAQALAAHHGLPYVELSEIPPTILGLIPAETQRRLRLVPFALQGGTLCVAVADPADSTALGELGRPLRVHVAASDEIDAFHTVATTSAPRGPATEKGRDESSDDPFGTLESDAARDGQAIDEIFSEPQVSSSAPAPSAKRSTDSDLIAMLSSPPVDAKPVVAPTTSLNDASGSPTSPSGLWNATGTSSPSELAAMGALEEVSVPPPRPAPEPPPPVAPPPVAPPPVAPVPAKSAKTGTSGHFPPVVDRPRPPSGSFPPVPSAPRSRPAASPPSASPPKRANSSSARLPPVSDDRLAPPAKVAPPPSTAPSPRSASTPQASPPIRPPPADARGALPLPDWLAASGGASAPPKEPAWTGALESVPASKLALVAVRALVNRGLLTEAELLDLLAPKR